MGVLNDIGGAVSGAVGAVNNALAGQNYTANDFQKTGFIVPPIPSADGNGLPSSKIPSQQLAITTRNIAHWFVPEVGIVNMYINPQSIRYNNSKLISNTRTKGGYSIQYWGEQLTTLNIDGHTGSSGVEGLNVLYEIYRAEQLIFDNIALTMAADNSITGLDDTVNSALGNIGGLAGGVLDAATGLFGLDPASQNVLPRNPPSLAAMAMGLELYYNGWVFRGYMSSFNFTESVNNLGIFEYNIEFIVTQRRGYRTNYLAFQRSAIDGPSNAQAIPLSFSDVDNGQQTSFLGVVNSAGNGPFNK